ncbi:hypothetical protein [Streptomyces boninensis]|uniref:hypothetical protein n=1 Tax=Streptomyces boninensis TaxID=2039455 RepID=UPI003B227355
MEDRRRNQPGTDLCGRRQAITQVECYLPDTHYPHPHAAIDGTVWHDALCHGCHGSGWEENAICGVCNGGGFALLET